MSEVNYSYANGMKYVDLGIDHQGYFSGATDGVISPDELVIPKTADVEAALARIQTEIDNPYTQQVETPHGTQTVEYTVLNRDVEPDGVMAMLCGWGGDFHHPVGTREYAAIALQFPSTHILAINFPGSAGSDNLPTSVAREMARTGSFMPAAEILEPVVSTVFADYENHIIAGASVGGRAAIAIGARREAQTEIVRAIEPVGVRKFGYFGIMKAFMLGEGGHAKQYVANSADTDSVALQVANDSLPSLLGKQFSALRRGDWCNVMVRIPTAMGHQGLRHDLTLLVPKVTKEITIVSPDASELNGRVGVFNVMADVALEASDVPTIYRQRVLPKRSHAYLIGTPAAQAAVLRD